MHEEHQNQITNCWCTQDGVIYMKICWFELQNDEIYKQYITITEGPERTPEELHRHLNGVDLVTATTA